MRTIRKLAGLLAMAGICLLAAGSGHGSPGAWLAERPPEERMKNVLLPAELRQVAFENVRIAFFNGYAVVKRDRRRDGTELVEPVVAQAEYIER